MTEQSADTAEAESPLVYLVAGEASGSKLERARELGIRGVQPEGPREREHGQPPDQALGGRRQLRAPMPGEPGQGIRQQAPGTVDATLAAAAAAAR